MHNVLQLGPDARRILTTLQPKVADVLATLDRRDRDLFLLRLERYFQNLYDGLKPVYGRRGDFEEVLERLVLLCARRYLDRPEDLKLLDIERDLTPDWFQRETMLGYVFYVERFAGSLDGVREHLDYLEEIGANYLHLMYALEPREGENDGGYAIKDYRSVDPRLGTIDDLEALCDELRRRGISVCIDLVLNHCADQHAWAVAAEGGDAHYQQFFYTFPDRTVPDLYEATLPEVFPDMAPGNFTWNETMQRWVWTTFHTYQWDLNWTNPEVFLEVTDIMFDLANRGIDIFRLDAVAFMWKRQGTNCQNQHEVHDLLQALRAVSKITTPAVAHKAEAIVSPDDLIHYFGTGRRYGKVSNIAYHNVLMVHFWSSLASRDTTLMTRSLQRFPRTPASIAWATYIRVHDDIGWAITDEDAATAGFDGFAHRSFLSDYYSGTFPGSHARGAVFGFNPRTRDRRVSGSFASLAGLEKALEDHDERLIALSIERILLGHALISGWGGIPLIYMGDEIALLNDYGYVNDPETADDNRWMHRPYMDWRAAERRSVPGTVEARVFQGIRRIVQARKRTPHLNSAYPTEVLDVEQGHLFATLRPHPLGNLLGLYNFSEHHQQLDSVWLERHGLVQPYDQLEQRFVDVADGVVRLSPYQRLWLI